MRKGRVRLLTVLLLLALVAAACGSRVTEQQIQASGQAGGAGGGVDGGGASGDGFAVGDQSSTVSGGTDAAGVAGTDAGATPGDPAAAAPAAGGATGGEAATAGGGAGGGQPAPAAPEGGNGGATDVGVTGDSILLGNVSTLSGPVPGLFQGAVVGTQAVVAYQNSLGGMFGRKFKLDVRDDQLDTGQNRSHTQDLLGKAFAFVGSFSIYDNAAAPEIGKSGIPDVTYSLNSDRRSLANNFSPSPAPPRGAPTGAFNYFKNKFPGAIDAVGTLYTELAKASHEDFKAAAESVGYRYVYERAFQATETDFTADVISMRQEGVKFVFLVAMDEKTIARIAKAMQQQNFKPQVFLTGGPGYHPGIVPLAGDAVEGMFSSQPYSLFAGEDAAHIPEVKLFNEWVQKVKPGWKPDLFTAFAWSAGRLFFQALEAAGPKATRADVLRELSKVTEFSANGMLTPANPAGKKASDCLLYAVIKGGKYERFDTPPPGYRCGDGPYLTR